MILMRNGGNVKLGSREGVVPASYVDVIKTRPATKRDQEQRCECIGSSGYTETKGF